VPGVLKHASPTIMGHLPEGGNYWRAQAKTLRWCETTTGFLKKPGDTYFRAGGGVAPVVSAGGRRGGQEVSPIGMAAVLLRPLACQARPRLETTGATRYPST
jgi:hypothetical protein